MDDLVWSLVGVQEDIRAAIEEEDARVLDDADLRTLEWVIQELKLRKLPLERQDKIKARAQEILEELDG